MSALGERWEFAKAVVQGLAAVGALGKLVVELVKRLATRKAERTSLVERLAEAEAANVVLAAQAASLRTALARESAGREAEARAHKTLVARVRAERDGETGEVELMNVTFLKDER